MSVGGKGLRCGAAIPFQEGLGRANQYPTCRNASRYSERGLTVIIGSRPAHFQWSI